MVHELLFPAGLFLGLAFALASWNCVALAECFSRLSFRIVSFGLSKAAREMWAQEALFYLLEQIWYDQIRGLTPARTATRGFVRALNLLVQAHAERHFYRQQASDPRGNLLLLLRKELPFFLALSGVYAVLFGINRLQGWAIDNEYADSLMLAIWMIAGMLLPRRIILKSLRVRLEGFEIWTTTMWVSAQSLNVLMRFLDADAVVRIPAVVALLAALFVWGWKANLFLPTLRRLLQSPPNDQIPTTP